MPAVFSLRAILKLIVAAICCSSKFCSERGSRTGMFMIEVED